MAREWKPYLCLRCKKTFDQNDIALIPGPMRCPYCASRLIVKTRPPIAKTVKTI
ncbi:MAG: DNA-directed RNA polymerase subunit P [Thermoproteales archaeon]|nr:DNA-directed RNA polymerase subunit P [Thermoproteales archaeon]RLE64785.1 MAG: DNA-directed RNA polymerase subunit P [Thermoprotei archaeon]